MAVLPTPSPGPIGGIEDETQRHQAVRGLLLMALAPAAAQVTPLPPLPSGAEVHAIQCVAWALSQYGTTLGGYNWGAPVAPGICAAGRGVTNLDDDVCIDDFTVEGSPSASELEAATAFVASCLAREGFARAALAGDAGALAEVCTTPPFAPTLLPMDLEEASATIGVALKESTRLVVGVPGKGGGAPTPQKGGGGLPVPLVVEDNSTRNGLLIGGGVLLVGGAVAYAVLRKRDPGPARLQNPARRRGRR